MFRKLKRNFSIILDYTTKQYKHLDNQLKNYFKQKCLRKFDNKTEQI